MLISRDPNTQSAPNFLKRKEGGNNKKHQDRSSRKSILKKHEQTKKEMDNQVQNFRKSIREFNKENDRYKVSIVVDDNSNGSYQDNMKREQKKKTTFFDSLQTSQRGKNRNKSRKMTHLSTGSDRISNKNYHNNYKQSKIDIIFTNSNISDEIWDPIDENIIDQIDERNQTTKNQLQSSDVVEVSLHELNNGQIVPKINFNMISKYQMKYSDRIMEESTQRDSKSSNIFNDKQSVSTRNPSQSLSINQLNRSNNNERRSSYYLGFQEQEDEDQQQFFTIIQSPPVLDKDDQRQKILQSTIKEQNERIEMTKTSKSQLTEKSDCRKSIYQQKIQQSRQRLKSALNESIYKYPEQLGFSMNKTDSNVISKSTYMSRFDKVAEFREQMFQKINLYRFLNRLEYKIAKYLSFESNQDILRTLVQQIIRKKCYILLNAQIQLDSLTKSQRKYDEQDRQLFIQIIQTYIVKESKMPYWKQVESEFQKVSFLCFQLKDTAIQFLLETIPEVWQSIKPIRGKLDRGNVTYETLLLQLRVKILKYLYYDFYKMNVTQHSRPSSIRDTPINKQRRLKKIIEQNEWFEKIPSKELLQQFKFLKQDVQHLCEQF